MFTQEFYYWLISVQPVGSVFYGFQLLRQAVRQRNVEVAKAVFAGWVVQGILDTMFGLPLLTISVLTSASIALCYYGALYLKITTQHWYPEVSAAIAPVVLEFPFKVFILGASAFIYCQSDHTEHVLGTMTAGEYICDAVWVFCLPYATLTVAQWWVVCCYKMCHHKPAVG